MPCHTLSVQVRRSTCFVECKHMKGVPRMYRKAHVGTSVVLWMKQGASRLIVREGLWDILGKNA